MLKLLQLIIISSIFLLALTLPVEAKVYIDITSPASRKIPIAVAGFNTLSSSGTPSEAIAQELGEVIIGDLGFSNFFDILSRDNFVKANEEAGLDLEAINFMAWRETGSELLIKGKYDVQEIKNNLSVELMLYDVVKESLLIAKRYHGKRELLRKIAHRFANEIMEEVTGEKGIFETRIAYVSTPSNKNKQIYVIDYDGYNLKKVTNNKTINIFPRWSPYGDWLSYTSYKEGEPFLYVRNTINNKDFRISNQPGINIGARWSPSGKEIALTLSIDGNPELYIMDIGTGDLRRLTKNWGIDVSPTWSSDGKRIAFLSDISGSPQIYAMDRNGKNLKRLTSGGKYYSSPAWSPTEDKIVFSKLENGHFNIWLMNSDGTEQTRLTSNSGDNENPSWSPNGRYIVFDSNRDGNSHIYIMRSDGTGQRRITRGSNPSWSPF